MEEFVDYYEMLELEKNASVEEIEEAIKRTRKRFRRLEGSPDAMQRANAERMMQLLNEADSLFHDSAKRMEYDAAYDSGKCDSEKELEKDARFGLPKEHSERGVYIAKGIIEVSGVHYREGQLLVFDKGADPLIRAITPATLMLLGGEPLGYRYIWWNFVSSRSERIEQAKEDWKQGRIILPPNDHDEYIPLPEDKGRPAGGPPRPEPLS